MTALSQEHTRTHVGGAIHVTPPVLDPRKLKKYRADEERETWWRERLRRVYDQLSVVT